MEKTNKNLNRIKVILAEKNLQNKWLAEKIGRDQATVSKWATNSTQPSLDMLIKIAKALEVELTDLVRYVLQIWLTQKKAKAVQLTSLRIGYATVTL